MRCKFLGEALYLKPESQEDVEYLFELRSKILKQDKERIRYSHEEGIVSANEEGDKEVTVC